MKIKAVLFLLVGLVLPLNAGADVFVFAAASTADVMGELGEVFTRKTGKPVKASFASSSAVARQIENGAPADVFISANEKWMDYLERKKLILPATIVAPFKNRLALVSAIDGEPKEIKAGFPLAEMLGEGRLAMGDPVSVPAGSYARQALKTLGIWQGLQGRTAFTRDVRSALVLVERGEVPYGIVYATDARLAEKSKVLGVFPEDTHRPIIYLAAAVKGENRRDAAEFLKFLCSDEGQAVVKAYGFQGGCR